MKLFLMNMPKIRLQFMKIGDYLRRLMAKKGKLHTYVDRPYERSKCDICGQICYNREDLQLHLKYNHPDVQSAPASR
jgi:hypothetical protein